MTKRWGAEVADWDLFAKDLGLSPDLLPVVSNPDAPISLLSRMKEKGKTPSVYNHKGEVVGIPDWVRKAATPKQIEQWKRQPDYGICVQTRNVRAWDIDVENSREAERIVYAIEEQFGTRFPLRARSNSGKCLLAFRLEGIFPKRKLPVKGGMLEFLGDGRQFVAAGTHPSGARYEWSWVAGTGGACSIPTLTPDEFARGWEGLVATLGTGEAVIERERQKRIKTAHGSGSGTVDPVLELLDVLEWGPDGQAYIECPWKDEHTSDTGIAQTCYFPEGTGGFDRGHFKCFHAHCDGRTDEDFLTMLGHARSDFEGVADLKNMGGADEDTSAESDRPRKQEPSALPGLQRTKTGKPLATVHNVRAVLSQGEATGLWLGFDEFKGSEVVREEETSWRPLRDTDYVRIQLALERLNFEPVTKERIRDVAAFVCEQNMFDSLKDWIGLLPTWDGVERVRTFLMDYLGVEEGPYAQGASRYLWSALAGRALVPGIKADVVPILVGPQGTGKSGIANLLAPSEEDCVNISFAEDRDSLARKMRGRVVAVVDELKGLASRDLETIKSFVTETHDRWIPKFKEFPVMYARRAVFIGTSNPTDFLSDTTGNRRWLPITVGAEARLATADEKARGVHAFEAFKRDKLQLWAEAVMLFLNEGICERDVAGLIDEVHKRHLVEDPWDELVERWLTEKNENGQTRESCEKLKVTEVLREAVNVGLGLMTKAHEMRIARSLKRLGWERRAVREGEKMVKVWVKIDDKTIN